ncbi:TonB-dependent receptor [Sphingomonas oligophenolica]|uniref:TonB-dependent receptor n=1 Tax=Sphingomonas oligophenolica TaxID=301154 RepID=A0ABU9Y184_9SPHN
MNTQTRFYARASGTALAVVISQIYGFPAQAQKAGPSAATSAPVEQTGAAGSADQPIGDIVVTATRRNASLLDTPATVSVLTSETIEKGGISRPSDFVRSIPNITISQVDRAGEAFVTVRGLAQARSADSIVAVIVDGVQLASAEELNQELFDIDQIEVLKGPQGALYGRNAIGGAIVIRTKPPTDFFQATASAGYGNADAFKATASLNIPIAVDKAYLRVGAYQRSNDGFFYNATTKRNVDPLFERGARARLDLTPTQNLTVSIRGNVSRFEGAGVNYVTQIGVLNTDDTSIPFLSNVIGRDVQNKYGMSAVVDYDVGPGNLVLTPAHTYVYEHIVADGFPYTPVADTTQRAAFKTTTSTLELKYTSKPVKGFSYIVGGYYAHINRNDSTTTGQDTGNGIVTDGVGPFPAGSVNPTLAIVNDKYIYNVYAAFAQVNVPITETLNLAGAIRYDREQREQTNISPPAFSTFSGSVRRQTYEGVEPKLTISYKPLNNLNLYIDYGQGFVSGGFNPAQTATLTNNSVPSEYGKQVNRALEVGFKTSFLDRRVQLNVAAFRSRVSNLQQFQFIPAATLQTINPIAKSNIQGIEFDSTIRFKPFTFFIAGGLTDGKIKSFPSDPTAQGNRLPNVPEYTVNLGAQYDATLSDTLRGSIRVDYQRVGPQWFDIANTPGSRRSAVDLVDARINVGSDRWTLSFFGKNIFDKRYNAESIVLLPFIQALTPALPRTYGAELKVVFR